MIDSVVADSDGCSELTCTDGLRISLIAQGGIVVPGNYAIAVETDDTTTGCGFVVEAPGDACGVDSPCLVLDECGLLAGFSTVPHTLGFTVPRTPPLVGLSVSRNGEAVAGDNLAPDYTAHAPNGADCLPVCQIAVAEVALR